MALLPSDTSLGRVALTVRDLQTTVVFYRDTLGMTVLIDGPERKVLGAGENQLVELLGRPQAPVVRGMTGLFHLAIRVPTRLDLGLSLRRLVEQGAALQGFADHLVSEAVYLSDLEGNGIEIYRDRPRDQWPRRDGQLVMGTESLAVEEILEQAQASGRRWAGLDRDTVIGHVHLHVDDLQAAERFYTEVIGFDLIMRYGPSAGFVSAGGYHHHVGYNTWAGVGAPHPPAGAAGLRWYTVHVPERDAFDALKQRLSNHGFQSRSEGAAVFITDPAQNQIRFVATSRNV